MKTDDALKIIAGIVAGVVIWKGYQGAKQSIADALDTIAGLPGRAWGAVSDAAQAVVDGTAVVSTPWGDVNVSDKNGGGFVTEAAPARIVDYSANRNIDPLAAYFIRWGNTADTRAKAYKAGWTADEISLAVLVMAQANGNL